MNPNVDDRWRYRGRRTPRTNLPDLNMLSHGQPHADAHAGQ